MELDYKHFSEQLIAQIAALLYDHDRVILPYFGAFVATYCPAQLLFGVNQLAPAKKQLVFDPQQTPNDNLFINAFALTHNFSHTQAENLVNQWVEAISGQLLELRSLDFDKIGCLYFNHEAKLELRPAETNFWRPSAGLPIVAALPIIREKITLPPPVIDTPDFNGKKREKKMAFWSNVSVFTYGFLVLGVGLGLAVGAFFLYKKLTNNSQSQPLLAQTDSISVNQDLTMKNSSVDSLQNAILMDTSNNSNPNTDNSNTNTDNSNSEKTREPRTETRKSENASDYIIIVGAFAEAKNAKRMRRKLEKEGYFIDLATTYAGYERIGVQISCSPDELKQHLKEIRRKFSSKAWVLK